MDRNFTKSKNVCVGSVLFGFSGVRQRGTLLDGSPPLLQVNTMKNMNILLHCLLPQCVAPSQSPRSGATAQNDELISCFYLHIPTYSACVCIRFGL